MSLYARGYDVNDSDFSAAGAGDLQLQIYDRHWDATNNDGVTAVDDLEYRMGWLMERASNQGLAFLPQHLNFAKRKAENPDAQLLSDGTHAHKAVQEGLAAMSYVSRTGQAIICDDEQTENDIMARFGEETIRQWSTLSETGEFIPESSP